MEFAPIIIVMIILVIMALGVFRALATGLFGKKRNAFVCPACGTTGQPKQVTRGHLLIEIILWLFFIIPGLIYSIWRLSTRYGACPACGAAGMIPVDSPNGRRLAEQAKQP